MKTPAPLIRTRYITLAVFAVGALILAGVSAAQADPFLSGKLMWAPPGGTVHVSPPRAWASPPCCSYSCTPWTCHCVQCRRPQPPRVYYPRYVAPEIDLHRYRFGYPPSQIDPYRRPYVPPRSQGRNSIWWR